MKLKKALPVDVKQNANKKKKTENRKVVSKPSAKTRTVKSAPKEGKINPSKITLAVKAVFNAQKKK